MQDIILFVRRRYVRRLVISQALVIAFAELENTTPESIVARSEQNKGFRLSEMLLRAFLYCDIRLMYQHII